MCYVLFLYVVSMCFSLSCFVCDVCVLLLLLIVFCVVCLVCVVACFDALVACLFNVLLSDMLLDDVSVLFRCAAYVL